MRDETLIEKAIFDETISNGALKLLVYIKLYGYNSTMQVSLDTNIDRRILTDSLKCLLDKGYIKSSEICRETFHKLKWPKKGYCG